MKILVYKDEGVDPLSLNALLASLKYEKINQIYCVDRKVFQTNDWQKDTHLVIFPGGRDVPYHNALQGTSNRHITEFVEQGGNFLGICAGGYYGSAIVEFEKGNPLEVVAKRELQFFPGIAQGPAYGLGKFCYQSAKGAQISALELTSSGSSTAAYFNGGCAFVDAQKHENVSVLARYADIETSPAAIIKCKVGDGQAILSGVHPEYSAIQNNLLKHLGSSLFSSLKEIENRRRSLFITLLKNLSLV